MKFTWFIHTSFACFDFGAHYERYKELRQPIRTVRPNGNVKDVLLLHDNARPHTSFSTRDAIAKNVMGCS
jgi:hypothetical protein